MGKGDSGETSLFSGEQVSKDDDRVEAFGDLDERLTELYRILALQLYNPHIRYNQAKYK